MTELERDGESPDKWAAADEIRQMTQERQAARAGEGIVMSAADKRREQAELYRAEAVAVEARRAGQDIDEETHDILRRHRVTLGSLEGHEPEDLREAAATVEAWAADNERIARALYQKVVQEPGFSLDTFDQAEFDSDVEDLAMGERSIPDREIAAERFDGIVVELEEAAQAPDYDVNAKIADLQRRIGGLGASDLAREVREWDKLDKKEVANKLVEYFRSKAEWDRRQVARTRARLSELGLA